MPPNDGVQWSESRVVRGIDVRVSFQKKGGSSLLGVVTRQQQGRAAVGRGFVHSGSSGQQGANRFDVPVSRGEQQWRHSENRASANIGAAFDETARDI